MNNVEEIMFVEDSDSEFTIVEDNVRVVNEGGGGITEESDPTVPSYVKNITESDIQSWNSKIGESNLVRSFDIEDEYTPESNEIYNAYAINELMMIFGQEIENDRALIEEKIDKSDIVNNFDVMENDFPQDTTKIYNVYAINTMARLFGEEISNVVSNSATQKDLQDAVNLAETYINQQISLLDGKKPDTKDVERVLIDLDNIKADKQGVVDALNLKADKTELDALISRITALENKHITLTQSEYDALVSAGTVDENTYYYIKGE